LLEIKILNMESSQDISVAEFLSICINIAEESGKIIRQVYASGNLESKEKD
jgi:hypothetical protein